MNREFGGSCVWRAALVGAVLSTGCAGGSESPEVAEGGVVTELRSEVARVIPDVGESARAARSQQEFAFEFLRTLAAEENVVFSPYSLSTAFAMTTDAAAGQTAGESWSRSRQSAPMARSHSGVGSTSFR